MEELLGAVLRPIGRNHSIDGMDDVGDTPRSIRHGGVNPVGSRADGAGGRVLYRAYRRHPGNARHE